MASGRVASEATTAGASCEFPSGDADPGLFDDRKRCIDGEDCQGGICGVYGKKDDDCFFDDSECQDGLYCAGEFPDTTCQPVVKQGAGGVCQRDINCDTGFRCSKANNDDTFVSCVARKAAGEDCSETIVNGTECAGYCEQQTKKCVSFCDSQ